MPWDNSVAENFFSHLKTEMYHQHTFGKRLAARAAVMEYIEGWYNRRWPNLRACLRHPSGRGPRHPSEPRPGTLGRVTRINHELSQKLDDLTHRFASTIRESRRPLALLG